MSIVVKDPANIARFILNVENEEATLCILIDHYEDQKTIPAKEATRLKEMVNSPDKENMELAKTLLQLRYHILS